MAKLTESCIARLPLLLLLIAAPAAAAKDLAGACPMTGLTLAESPWRFTGAITVAAGKTCTIEAGVVINGQNFALNVTGSLVANGTDVSPITFNNVSLTFSSGSTGTLSKCTLTDGPLTITDASPSITGCTLSSLQVAYDRKVLEIVAIDGGASPGFTDPPLTRPGSFRNGYTAFAGLFTGTGDAHRRAHVATIVFRVRAGGGSATTIGVRALNSAPFAVRPGFQTRRLRSPRVIHVALSGAGA